MVHVTRREHETGGALIRRFSRKVQRSGVVLQARKTRFFSRKPNRGEKRRSALRRSHLQEEQEILFKLGKLDERKGVF